MLASPLRKSLFRKHLTVIKNIAKVSLIPLLA